MEKKLIRMEKIHEQTEVVIRSQGYTKGSKTKKGKAMISLLLFNLYMAKLEEKLRNKGLGGVGIGRMRM